MKNKNKCARRVVSKRNRAGERAALRTLSAALIDAQNASSAKSAFLSRMSHEIRTPLNAIIGMAAIASAQMDNRDAVEDCLVKIERSSKHLLALVNDILDMSKIEEGKLAIRRKPFRLSELLESVSAIILSQTYKKHLTLELPSSDSVGGILEGDILRLSQILLNLLTNAVKFTPEGGRVRLEVRELRGDTEYVWLEFTVSDTGVGIGEEFMERLFAPFEQEDSGNPRQAADGRLDGCGLGLSITKDLVSTMGGTIRVESKKGEGAAFIIELPLGRGLEEPQVCGQQSEPATRNLCGRRLLLAEDNQLNREIAVSILQMQGVEVDCAENGRQAVDIFLASDADRYDAILMDVRMPVMDGYRATREIRGSVHPRASTVPILAMTANVFSDDVSATMAAGMNAHLTKPIDPELLSKTLFECISGLK